MKLNRLSAIISTLTLATMFNLLSVVKPATAGTLTLFGLDDKNTLFSFGASDPTATSSIGVTGVDGTLLGIDFRPANGLLYGLADSNKIYTIDTSTGAATFVSTLSTSFTAGLKSGFDFNPVPDRLRLVGTNEQNLRTNVDTGAVITDGTLAYGAGDINAGADPNITAAAYTNSFKGAIATQLYGIDSDLDTLVLQNPPNNGTLTTIGSLGFDFDETGGFDIFTADGVNTAIAASNSNLYSVDLSTGATTALGIIGSGDIKIVGLAATSVPEPGTVGALIGFGAFGLLSGYRRRAKSLS
ncbi:DUF4394 domain-containing protein [Argonema galeatum]|uniref:DUF4394 domain-containing protein n=1 Tax=Argonema galeatum TaxID=2942762 RepID=UPI002013AD49|nr:DUF4394 domain-containing protein [Argonema galeatum]MCL1465816.1 DUF4394 domain-containing protein [Argonema galeatum A003/A1]